MTHPSPVAAAIDTLDQPVARATDELKRLTGLDASWVAAAPGRVNLIGEHIDYCDGFVLPMAIERYVVIAAVPSEKPSPGTALVYSLDVEDPAEIPLGKSSGPTNTGWGKYLEGVVAGFADRGIEIPSFEAVVASNVPHGGGLSSSAALEVATATLLEAVTGTQLEAIDKALVCQRAEHEFAGVPCGIMDQFSSVFGQADQLMLIDCRSQQCDAVPFNASGSGISVLITNSNVKHELTGGEYAERRGDCERALAVLGKESWRDVTLGDVSNSRDQLSPTEYVRARHVVTETARTLDAAAAFQASDWPTVGRLMYDSHTSLRDDFEVSCGELDALVEIAQEIGPEGGVIGSRMTGGGFGGCTVSLVENAHLSKVVELIEKRYQERTGLACSCFSSRPARGAHLVTESS